MHLRDIRAPSVSLGKKRRNRVLVCVAKPGVNHERRRSSLEKLTPLLAYLRTEPAPCRTATAGPYWLGRRLDAVGGVLTLRNQGKPVQGRGPGLGLLHPVIEWAVRRVGCRVRRSGSHSERNRHAAPKHYGGLPP